MDNYIILIINIISIVFILLNIFILLVICRIHSKRKYLRIKYFGVVFTQIILELLLNIIFLITIIVSFFLNNNIQNRYLYIFSVLINFLYNIDIIYNIQTIVNLMNSKNLVDSNDVFSNNDDGSKSDLGTVNTIEVNSYSVKRIHLFSFFISIIHSIIYFFLFFYKNEINQEREINWYFFFISKMKII